MITAPAALLNEYSNFHPVEIEYLNVVRARREMVEESNRWRRIVKKVKPDEFTADFGPVLTAVMVAAGVPLRSPSFQVRWDFVESKLNEEGIDLVESKISQEGSDLSQAKEEHYHGALKYQKRCLAKGAYRHNVGQWQKHLTPDRRTLLNLPERKEKYPSDEPPLMETLPNHLELLVVDALLVLQRTTSGEIESYLSDYPPLLRKGYDHKITLGISEEVKERLARRPELTLGWHPYCRILGQFRSLGGLNIGWIRC
jgi:hypothetical protein